MVALWIFDAGAAAVLGITALIGAYLPVVLARRGQATGTRSVGFVLGNMLSCGVMIAAGFIGLLGEAALELAPVSTYPLGPFLAALGFLATLLADYVAQSFSGSQDDSAHALLHGVGGKGGDKDSDPGDLTPHHHASPKPPMGDMEMGPVDRHGAGAMRGRRQPQQAPGQMSLVDVGAEQSDSAVWHAQGEAASSKGADAWDAGSVLGTAYRDAAEAAAAARAQGLSVRDLPAAAGFARTRVSLLTAVLMAVALTFHSLLEGAALGAAQDVAHSAHIFIAIQAHKGLTAFALGSSLVESAAPPLQFWSLVLLMASATPVGIAVGFLLSGLTNNTGASCISAVAAGTFIYVAIVEILPKELAEPDYKGMKVFMLFVGFGLMAFLALWA